MIDQNPFKHALSIGLLCALLTGCDSSSTQNETAAPPRPEISLAANQSEEEVRELLGPPSGILTISDKTVLLYSGMSLEFVDGKLTKPASNVLHQIEMCKADAAARAKASNDWAEKISTTLKKAIPKGRIHEVQIRNRQGEVIDHSGLVNKGKITVVDFYATWCGPCKQMDPILRKMVRGQSDVVLRKVDIRNWGSATATRYQINSVPNVRVFDSAGRLVAPPTSNPSEIQKYIEVARRQSD